MHLGGKCGEIGETTTVWGSFASPVPFFSLTVEQRQTVFMLFTLHQTSSCGPRRCPQWKAHRFPLFPIRWFLFKSLKISTRVRWQRCACVVSKPRCMQNPVARVQIHTNSHDFPWRKVAYRRGKLKEYENSFCFFFFSLQRFMKNG